MKTIIYVAGERGQNIYNTLHMMGRDDLIECFCDRGANSILYIGDKTVCRIEEIDNRGKYLFLISPISKSVCDEMISNLGIKLPFPIHCMEGIL